MNTCLVGVKTVQVHFFSPKLDIDPDLIVFMHTDCYRNQFGCASLRKIFRWYRFYMEEYILKCEIVVIAKIQSGGLLVEFARLDNSKGSFALRKDFPVTSVFMNI